MRLFFALLIVLSLLSSCDRHPCGHNYLTFSLVAFSDAEADTVRIRRFNVNSTTPIDSFLFDVNNPIRFIRSNDTLSMSSYPGNAVLYTGFDYQLVFPGAAKTYKITEITEEQSYRRKGLFASDDLCINNMLGFKVDGTFVYVNGFSGIIYLRR